MKKLTTPFDKKILAGLKAGEEVLLSGIIYTARDQAHKRLVDLILAGKKLPVDLAGQIIYYCGPTATPAGKVIGACGPTTSSRMDAFLEPLLAQGLTATIGKGRRKAQARNVIAKYKAVYFVAPAGCGALLAGKVVKNKLIAFKELGPEAIHELEVKDFPLVVAIDASGNSLYPDL
jgi:fumarate hydratase subunit beta